MEKLIFVRHSKPQIQPEVPSNRWSLSAEGRCLCQALAEDLAAFAPDRIFTSTEPKAIETGEILGNRLNVSCTEVAELSEHDRSNVPFFPSAKEFEQRIAAFFEKPDELVFGRESALKARERFCRGLEFVLGSGGFSQPVIVTHGTVLALYLGARLNRDPLELWKQFSLPCYAVVSYDGKLLTEIQGVKSP